MLYFQNFARGCSCRSVLSLNGAQSVCDSTVIYLAAALWRGAGTLRNGPRRSVPGEGLARPAERTRCGESPPRLLPSAVPAAVPAIAAFTPRSAAPASPSCPEPRGRPADKSQSSDLLLHRHTGGKVSPVAWGFARGMPSRPMCCI